MAKAPADFTSILLRKNVLGPDQLEEARNLATSGGMKIQDAIRAIDQAIDDERRLAPGDSDRQVGSGWKTPA